MEDFAKRAARLSGIGQDTVVVLLDACDPGQARSAGHVLYRSLQPKSAFQTEAQKVSTHRSFAAVVWNPATYPPAWVCEQV